MKILDVSNIWAIGNVALRCGCSVDDVEQAADALAIVGSAINGVPYVDAISAARIAEYIDQKRKGVSVATRERDQAKETPRHLN